MGLGEMWSRSLGRRSLLRYGLAGAAAAAAAGGSATASAASRATRQDPAITLTWAVNYQGIAWTTAQNNLTQKLLAQYWLPQHPGVRVNTFAGSGSNGPSQGSSGAIAAILAGNGPDILSGCCTDLPTYLGSGGILAPLDPWLKRDNLNAQTLFSPGHLAALTTAQGLVALPAYDGPQVLAVNEGMLDTLGLGYPNPDWTMAQADQLWSSASGHDAHVSGNWRYGVTLNWYTGGWGGYWVPPAFGGNWIDPTRTKSLFNSPAALRGFTWITDLFKNKVAIPRSAPGSSGGSGNVHNGLSAMGVVGGWTTLYLAENMQGLKWNYYPMPVFPSGQRSTMINVDFVGMNANTKYPELTWELFKFIGINKTYQRFNIQTTLVNPSLVDMWAEWEQIVRSVAPPLRDKNLQYFAQAVQYGHGHSYFQYEPLQANTLISNAMGLLPPVGKSDVGTVMDQLTRQIDALQANGPALEAGVAKELAQYRTYVRQADASSKPIEFPAPPRAGSGVPPTNAPKLVTVGAGGTYALLGAGGGIQGASDNGTFACQAFRPSQGTFSCRLVSIAAVKDKLSDGAKIGLMARADLTDNAAGVGLEVALGRGIHFHTRAVDGQGLNDNRPASNTASSGLIGKSVILSTVSKPAKNYLLKPVWLRLVLDGNIWTPFTSLDGTHWTQATPAAGVEFVGAWVGLFATSHNSGHYLQAVFDHVTGFSPDTFVQVGKP